MYKDFEKETLQDVLNRGQVTAPAVFDCISERTVELSGYKAAILQGAAFAYSSCGYPDMSLLSAEEIIYMTNRITNYSPLPIIVDADPCLGKEPSAVYWNVMRLAKSGADAVVITDVNVPYGEDRKFQKDFKLSVMSKADFLARIKAALKAVENTKCLVIAKTFAKIADNADDLADALCRIKAARELGANITCVEGAKTFEEAKAINKADSGLKMWNGIAVEDGKCVVEPSALSSEGFVLIAEYYTVKAGMYGMLYYGKKTLEDGNTVFHDTHDYDGLLEKGQDYHVLFSFGKLWLPMEDKFNDLSDIMAIPHEIEG